MLFSAHVRHRENFGDWAGPTESRSERRLDVAFDREGRPTKVFATRGTDEYPYNFPMIESDSMNHLSREYSELTRGPSGRQCIPGPCGGGAARGGERSTKAEGGDTRRRQGTGQSADRPAARSSEKKGGAATREAKSTEKPSKPKQAPETPTRQIKKDDDCAALRRACLERAHACEKPCDGDYRSCVDQCKRDQDAHPFKNTWDKCQEACVNGGSSCKRACGARDCPGCGKTAAH